MSRSSLWLDLRRSLSVTCSASRSPWALLSLFVRGDGDLEPRLLAGDGDRDCSLACFGDLTRWSFAFSLGGDLSLCDRLALAGDRGDLARSFAFSLGGDLSLSPCDALGLAGGDRAITGELFLRSWGLRLRDGVPLRSLSLAGERDLRGCSSLRLSTAEAIPDLGQHIFTPSIQDARKAPRNRARVLSRQSCENEGGGLTGDGGGGVGLDATSPAARRRYCCCPDPYRFFCFDPEWTRDVRWGRHA